MVVKRLKTSECGVELPGGLTGIGKGTRTVEPKNKNNTKPAKRGEGGRKK